MTDFISLRHTNPHFLAVRRFYRVDDKCLPVLLQVTERMVLVVAMGGNGQHIMDRNI
jgi:hypothetical protein